MLVLMDYKTEFAAKLRELREVAGVSIREAASRVTANKFACSKTTWMRWENGENSPPVEALPAIAAAFGKKITNLLP